MTEFSHRILRPDLRARDKWVIVGVCPPGYILRVDERRDMEAGLLRYEAIPPGEHPWGLAQGGEIAPVPSFLVGERVSEFAIETRQTIARQMMLNLGPGGKDA